MGAWLGPKAGPDPLGKRKIFLSLPGFKQRLAEFIAWSLYGTTPSVPRLTVIFDPVQQYLPLSF